MGIHRNAPERPRQATKPSLRCIVLGDGRRVGLGVYVAAIHTAKANPDRVYDRGQCGWWSVTGREIVARFGDMVADLINRHLPAREDRKGPAARLLRRLRDRGRECSWCGSTFTPRSLADRCCDPSCAAAYR